MIMLPDCAQHQSEKIKFFDWLSGDSLEELLTNAALFVLPSDMEGLSLALLDAMGAGVCVLASNVAENLEAVGESGFTFQAGSGNDLQRMLAKLIPDQMLRQNDGRRAQERVRENYLWEDAAKKMEAVYLDLFDWQTSSPAVPAKAVRKAA